MTVMRAATPIFRLWHIAVIGVWWIASAFAAGIVFDPDQSLWVRIAVALASFAIAVCAPGLLAARAARLEPEAKDQMLRNLFGGSFWALGFGVGMAGYYAVIDAITGSAGSAGSTDVLIFLLPPSAVAFAAATSVLDRFFKDPGSEKASANDSEETDARVN